MSERDTKALIPYVPRNTALIKYRVKRHWFSVLSKGLNVVLQVLGWLIIAFVVFYALQGFAIFVLIMLCTAWVKGQTHGR